MPATAPDHAAELPAVSICPVCGRRWFITPADDCSMPVCGCYGFDVSPANPNRPCYACGIAHASGCHRKPSRNRKRLPYEADDRRVLLPLLPTPFVLLPLAETTLTVEDEPAVELIHHSALAHRRIFCSVYAGARGAEKLGCAAEVVAVEELPGGTLVCSVRGLAAVEIEATVRYDGVREIVTRGRRQQGTRLSEPLAFSFVFAIGVVVEDESDTVREDLRQAVIGLLPQDQRDSLRDAEPFVIAHVLVPRDAHELRLSLLRKRSENGRLRALLEWLR